MYERFTDRARKTMQLANQEAQKLNHEYIGTEHILLGLIRENSIATRILDNLKVSKAVIKDEVLKLVVPGPELITVGKLPQTPRAKKVIEFSMEEARELKHNYVGTEHILLGLIREAEGVASTVLANLGLTLDAVRHQILSLLASNAVKPSIVDDGVKADFLQLMASTVAWVAMIEAQIAAHRQITEVEKLALGPIIERGLWFRVKDGVLEVQP